VPLTAGFAVNGSSGGHPPYDSRFRGLVGKQSASDQEGQGSNPRVNFEKDFSEGKMTKAGRCVPHPPSQVYSSIYAVGCPEINDKRRYGRRRTEPPKQARVYESRGDAHGFCTRQPRSGGVSRRKSYTGCKDPEIYDI